jgi:hypothetical protein
VHVYELAMDHHKRVVLLPCNRAHVFSPLAAMLETSYQHDTRFSEDAPGIETHLFVFETAH